MLFAELFLKFQASHQFETCKCCYHAQHDQNLSWKFRIFANSRFKESLNARWQS